MLEMMLKQGYTPGGEQSGHVIFLEYASTGDGELTALQFMSILKASGTEFARRSRLRLSRGRS